MRFKKNLITFTLNCNFLWFILWLAILPLLEWSLLRTFDPKLGFFLGGIGDVNAPDDELIGVIVEHAHPDSPECTGMQLFSILAIVLSSVLEDAIASSTSNITWCIASDGTVDGWVEQTFFRRAKPSVKPTDPSQPKFRFELFSSIISKKLYSLIMPCCRR